MTNFSDEELMTLVVDKNTRALKLLYERYGKSLFNFILRYTNNREISEDLLQESFTRVWFAAHTFKAEKGSFRTWLFTIGINTTRNEMTKKKYSFNYVELNNDTGADEEAKENQNEPGVNTLEHDELKDTISRALESLNPYLKEVIILKHFNRLKFSEISQITNTPEGTLKARFHNALAQMRKVLEKAEF